MAHNDFTLKKHSDESSIVCYSIEALKTELPLKAMNNHVMTISTFDTNKEHFTEIKNTNAN